MAKDAKYGDVQVLGIPDGEPIFILRARDAFAGVVLAQYRELRSSAGDVPDTLDLTINRFRDWPLKKLPT